MTSFRDHPHGLARFLKAQEQEYEMAMAEIRAGRKLSHWIWYIFPQLDGLAPSPSSNTRFYAIRGRAEARDYLAHPVLGARLGASMAAILGHPELSAGEIFGSVDAKKVWSCATLFASISPANSVFHKVLASHYGGKDDPDTLRLLASLG